MSEADIIRLVEVVVLLILALVSDIRSYKIKNPITLSFIVIGIATNSTLYGYKGLKLSVLGICTPLIILFFFFAASMLGAGDIKLFSAIGSIAGWQGAITIIVCSFLIGGVIAAVLMIRRRNALERFRYLAEYLRTCIMTFTILPYTGISDKNDNTKFRFTYAIVLGSMASLIFVR